MQVQSSDIRDYLAATAILDWQGTEVESKSNQLTKYCRTDFEKAEVLFRWVRDEIPHSKDIESTLVTCTATEVLAAGTGICFAKSHLLAAMLRAQGIPAGFCYQVLAHDPPYNGMTLHGLNAVYLGAEHQWFRIDCRGNTGSCKAEFAQNPERLAFTMNSERGEFIYPEIFANPVEVVVKALQNHTDLETLWYNLPASI